MEAAQIADREMGRYLIRAFVEMSEYYLDIIPCQPLGETGRLYAHWVSGSHPLREL
jgi:hypothetical protein